MERDQMEEFEREHSASWQELTAAYRRFREAVFYWAHEGDAVKHHDLSVELGAPVPERDLHRRLLVLDLLRSTEMWDEQAIALAWEELTEIALLEQDEAAACARMALWKIRRRPERDRVAERVFLLASAEKKRREQADNMVFHNGCELLHDLGCREMLRRFIQAYGDRIQQASGLDRADLNELLEQT